jgi:hypothetical protein
MLQAKDATAGPRSGYPSSPLASQQDHDRVDELLNQMAMLTQMAMKATKDRSSAATSRCSAATGETPSDDGEEQKSAKLQEGDDPCIIF